MTPKGCQHIGLASLAGARSGGEEAGLPADAEADAAFKKSTAFWLAGQLRAVELQGGGADTQVLEVRCAWTPPPPVGRGGIRKWQCPGDRRHAQPLGTRSARGRLAERSQGGSAGVDAALPVALRWPGGCG